jgi:thiol:disulfide interchange protein
VSLSSLIRSLCWLVGLTGQALAADDFLPPEQAFRFAARALDARQVEIGFVVADGYYLYREQFAFVAEGAGVTLGRAEVPAGKVLFDETFGKNVETHRGRVVIRLPVAAAPARFTLQVTSQGCADQGLCYPPMQSLAEVQLAAFGGTGAVRVTSAGSGFPAERPPSGAESPAATVEPGSGESAIDDAPRGGRFGVVVGVFFIAGLLLWLTPCVLRRAGAWMERAKRGIGPLLLAGGHDPLQPPQPLAARAADSASAGGGDATVAFRRVASVAELDAALRTTDRPVMLDFHADWCISCKQMERHTFTDPRVRASLDKMLLLQVDVTRNNAADRVLLKRFRLFGPPGIVFFDAAGREQSAVRVIGYQDAERFRRSLAALGL